MATEYGGEGGGERGRSIIPNHAAAGDLAGGCAPANVGPAESSHRALHLLPGEQGKTGRIYRRCMMCGGAMAAVPCAADDPLNGSRSDGYCDACKPIITREARRELGLVIECEACGAQLEIDGVCPSCHIGHDGPRCADCGRQAMHRTDCPRMQPPTIEDLIADANLTGLGLKPLPGGAGL